MDNLTVRALSEEMAYIKGYTDALGEINGKRRRKQEQQKKKSEHRAKVAAGIMCGTTLLVLSGIVGLIDKDATFCVFVRVPCVVRGHERLRHQQQRVQCVAVRPGLCNRIIIQ